MGSGLIWMVVVLGVLITAKFRQCIQIELKKMDGGEGAAISERNTGEQKITLLQTYRFAWRWRNPVPGAINIFLVVAVWLISRP